MPRENAASLRQVEASDLIQPELAVVSGGEPAAGDDVWSNWLLRDRHADDEEYGTAVQHDVMGYANRVLDGANLQPGMSLIDIGSGEGLVAFRAIERVGPTLTTTLTDVSAPMLRFAESKARELGIHEQCTFVECGADDLSPIASESADVVTTRSVLAYVADKPAAMAEFLRVLKPGGRLSIAEPIFRDEAMVGLALRKNVDSQTADQASQPHNRLIALLHRCKAAQFPDTEESIAAHPLVNYTERDLIGLAQRAGFTNVHLEFHVNVISAPSTSWNVYLRSSPHPWAPTLEQILAEQFTQEEREFFESIIRPAVESGGYTSTDTMAYLTAKKPPSA